MDEAAMGSFVDQGASRPAAGDRVTADAWLQLIRNRCGLTFRPAQVPAVMRTLDEARRSRDIDDPLDYFNVLEKEPEDGSEWPALLERLVNHETSFFRHNASFEAMRTVVLPQLIEQRPHGGRLHLLSAGCSTGQEAYSLAMVALAEERLHEDFTVWGIDISQQAIALARRGRYGPRAVASVPPGYRERFLRRVNEGVSHQYEVVDQVRQRVRFMPLNLLAPGGVSLMHDVIFCHNVLIYFSAAAARAVLDVLASRLTPGGYLLLGPGEGTAYRPPALETVTINGVRALRRRGSTGEARP